jgi:epoxyqueuosine reductase
MATERSRLIRADPRLLMPECKSILVLAVPYSKPSVGVGSGDKRSRGRIAAFARGEDYHKILPKRLKAIVGLIEKEIGHPVLNRYFTDSGPLLERDLAQRAGLGWMGKNTCLIHPGLGSYCLLAEVLLDLELEPDAPFEADRCGTCTRCLDACPTSCILPDRTLDAARCISYLTIELRDQIPRELRSKLSNWIFGCDVCQMVCPWNRFAAPNGDEAISGADGEPEPDLIHELTLDDQEFGRRFGHSPVRRARRGGYLRNAAVALGNSGDRLALPVLHEASRDPDALVREHATWAAEQITERMQRHA